MMHHRSHPLRDDNVTIVGLHIGHDASVAVLQQGKLVFAVSEERLTRTKGDKGFPAQALAEAVRRLSLSDEDPLFVAVPTLEYPHTWGKLRSRSYLGVGAAKFAFGSLDRVREIFSIPGIQCGADRFDALLQAAIRHAGISPKGILSFEHHYCHAMGAFLQSPFEQAVAITADARGDGKSLTLSIATGRDLTRFLAISDRHSLGQFYGAATQHLGFRHNRHEGKVMGLSARGDPATCGPKLMSTVHWQDDGRFALVLPSASADRRNRHWNRRERRVLGSQCNSRLRVYKRRWIQMLRFLDSLDARPVDVAAGIQYMLEEAIVELLRRNTDSGRMPLVASGGVFNNVRLSRRILDEGLFSNIYVQPAMGDEGLAVGAAIVGHIALTGAKSGGVAHDTVICPPHTYLGPEPGEEVARAARRHGMRIKPLRQPARQIATWAFQGQCIGLVLGRMEFGPRALGHRSILASPQDRQLAERLNSRLQRNDFMPFAPSILEECAHEYLCAYDPQLAANEYMTMLYRVKSSMIDRIPAVVHLDGTTRPQVVRAATEPFLHEVLSEFHRLSGIGVLLNTSFNCHEQPIVASIDDAVVAYKTSGIERLVINRTLIY